jgi:hypothetical protein
MMNLNGNVVSTWWPRITGALLCLAIAAVHILDQGGFPGSKTPHYVGVMYYALEAAAVLMAILLIARATHIGWWLVIGIGAGPMAGYILSRGPGLPAYTDDVGNWIEPLGLISLVVEAALLVLSATLLMRDQAGERERAQAQAA